MNKTNKDFIKINSAFFRSFLQELKIDDGKARLVWYFANLVLKMPDGSNNIVYAGNDDIMLALNISKPTVIKYINDLCRLNVIRRIKPRAPLYWINPEMIYRGRLK